MSESGRHVEFEACFNFRDLGGYETVDGRRLRWETIYRSDTLHRLTHADSTTFQGLGLRTVIDLRSRMEVDDHGKIEVAGAGFTWHNVPLLDDVKLAPTSPDDPPRPDPGVLAPGESYVHIVEEFSESLGRVFSILGGDGALPAVFHCTAGKDRTGIVAALMLEVLGVPDETIVADYVLTEAAHPRSMTWIEAHEPDFAAYLAEIPQERRAARPEKMQGFLARFRYQFGSAEEFLTSVGVTKEELEQIRVRMIEG